MSPQPNNNPESAVVLGPNFPDENPDDFYRKAESHEKKADELEESAKKVGKSKDEISDSMEGKTADAADAELGESVKDLTKDAEKHRELALKMRTYGDNLVSASANMNAIDDQYHLDYQAMVNQAQRENWSQDAVNMQKQMLLSDAQANVMGQATNLSAVQDTIVQKAVSGQPLDINDVISVIPAAAGAVGSALTGFATTATSMMGGAGGMNGNYGTPMGMGMGSPYGTMGASPYGSSMGMGSPYGMGASPYGMGATGSPYGSPMGMGTPAGMGTPYGVPAGAQPPQPGGIIGNLSKALGDFGGMLYGAATGNATQQPLGAYPANNNQFNTTPGSQPTAAPSTNPAGDALKKLSDQNMQATTPVSAKGHLSGNSGEASFRVGDTSGEFKYGDGEVSGRLDHTPGQTPPGADDAGSTAPAETPAPAPEQPPADAPAPEAAPEQPPADAPAPEQPPAEAPAPEAAPEQAPETDPATGSGENETMLSADNSNPGEPQTRLSSAGAATGHVQGGATGGMGAPMMGAPMMGAMGGGMGGVGGGSSTSGGSSRGKVFSSSNPFDDVKPLAQVTTPSSAPKVKTNTTGAATREETNYSLRAPGNANSGFLPAGAHGISDLDNMSTPRAGAYTRAAAVYHNWSDNGYDRLSGAIGVFNSGTTYRYVLATAYGVSYVPYGCSIPEGVWLAEQFSPTAGAFATPEMKLRSLNDTVGTLESVVTFGDGLTMDRERTSAYEKAKALTPMAGRLPSGYTPGSNFDEAAVAGDTSSYLSSFELGVPTTLSALIMLSTATDDSDRVRRFREFIASEIEASQDAHQLPDTVYTMKYIIDSAPKG